MSARRLFLRWRWLAVVPVACCLLLMSGSRSTAHAALSWSAPTKIDSTPLEGVSCSSESFCVAVDGMGHAMVYKSGSWSTPGSIDGTAWIRAVSCPSSTFCMALAAPSEAVFYDGSGWTTAARIPGSSTRLDSASCGAPGSCAVAGEEALDLEGEVFSYSSGSWSAPTGKLGGPNEGEWRVSCTSQTFCLAVSASGTTVTYNGSSWTVAASKAKADVEALSCATSAFCVAFGLSGNVDTFNGSSWSPPTNISSPSVLYSSISCASTTFCVVVDGKNSYVFNGSGWSTESNVDPDEEGYLRSVSCPTETFCAAVDYEGNAVTTASAPPQTTVSTVPSSGSGGSGSGGGGPTPSEEAKSIQTFAQSFEQAEWGAQSGVLPGTTLPAQFVMGFFEGTETGCELFLGPQATLGVGAEAGGGLMVSGGTEGPVPIVEPGVDVYAGSEASLSLASADCDAIAGVSAEAGVQVGFNESVGAFQGVVIPLQSGPWCFYQDTTATATWEEQCGYLKGTTGTTSSVATVRRSALAAAAKVRSLTVKHRYTTLPLLCFGGGPTASCKGTITLRITTRSHGRAQNVVMARARYDVKSRVGYLRLTLTRAGKSRLQHARHHTLTVTTVLSTPSQNVHQPKMLTLTE